MAHVMQDIIVDQFDDVVANISASMYLGFKEAELTSEGHNHNKALHIYVTYAYILISRVLVETRSSLNVLPKITLSQLCFEGPKMRANVLIICDFDGSLREFNGKLIFQFV